MRCSTAVWWAIAAAITSAGCVSGAGDLPPRPDAGRRDAGQDAGSVADAGTDPEDAGADEDAGAVDEDAGAIEDAGSPVEDAGTDAGMPDAGSPPMDAGSDAGTGETDAGTSVPVPTIDGIVSDSEWAGAISVENTAATIWSGSELRRMRARLHSTGLYLAIEGNVADSNAITVFVDRALGTSEGRAFAELTDTTGAVDNALSPEAGAPYTVPADFLVDLAWATTAMARSASGYDGLTGWRSFVANAGAAADFSWQTADEAPSTCSASACETYLPRSILDAAMGATRPRTVAIFARIASSDGSMSPNQTLPMDAPATPRIVSVLLELDE